jgi:hypothetical protein
LIFLASTAQAADASPAGVVQVFGCHLQEGKTADNIWGLMDALAAPGDGAGPSDPAFGLFVWAPYRGATEYDFVFGVLNSDLEAMAEGSTTYAGSDKGRADNRIWADTVSGCDSAIMASTQLADGSIGMEADRSVDAVVETFSCTINDGSDMDDVDGALTYWQNQLAKIDSPALDDYEAFKWTPIRGGTGSDLVFVGNSPSLQSWASGTSAYDASSEGQAADERFFKHTSCSNQLWMGYWVVVPEQF